MDPVDGQRYATRFPMITIFDMIRAQFHLLDDLGIKKLHASVGASMGGMQVSLFPPQRPMGTMAIDLFRIVLSGSSYVPRPCWKSCVDIGSSKITSIFDSITAHAAARYA